MASEPIRSAEDVARELFWDYGYNAGALDEEGLADLIRARDRAVAAKVLRDVVEDCERYAIDITLGGADYVNEWLRVRAYRIEEGEWDGE